MNCAALEHSIALYVEGDLQESERRKVELHLQGCSSCRELAGELMTSLAVFKELRQGLPQSSELSEVRHRVLNEVGDMQPAPGWVLAMHRLVFAGLRRKTAIAGVMLAVLVSGGVWLHHTPEKADRQLEQAVQVAQFESPPMNVLSDIHPLSIASPRPLNRVHSSKALFVVNPEISVEAPADIPVAEVPQVSQIPMKFLTDDPDIIIYWLPTDKGD